MEDSRFSVFQGRRMVSIARASSTGLDPVQSDFSVVHECVEDACGIGSSADAGDDQFRKSSDHFQ